MGQLNFAQNFNYIPSQFKIISNGTLSFVPFELADSISFLTMNLGISNSSANMTYTFSVGLYSLTGSSLSLANSISASISRSNSVRGYFSLTATSAAQNITPGNWWFGILVSTGGNSDIELIGQTTVNPLNAFPGAFIGGRMTASTAALPASYATSDLDTTGDDAMNIPMIILSS